MDDLAAFSRKLLVSVLGNLRGNPGDAPAVSSREPGSPRSTPPADRGAEKRGEDDKEEGEVR